MSAETWRPAVQPTERKAKRGKRETCHRCRARVVKGALTDGLCESCQVQSELPLALPEPEQST